MARMKDLAPENHKDYPDEDVFRFTHPDYHIEVVKTRAKMYCAECHKLRDSLADGEHCECEGDETPDLYLRAIFEFTADSREIVGALDRYCRSVTRERYCPKCRNRFMTVERFVLDTEEANRKSMEALHALDIEKMDLADRLREYEDLLGSFHKLMDKATGIVVKK